MDQVKIILSGIVLAITSLVSSIYNVLPLNTQKESAPQLNSTILVSQIPTSFPTALPIVRYSTVTPSATPSPTQELFNTCMQLSFRTEYFRGLNCYATEYDQYIKDNNISVLGGSVEARGVEQQLLSSKNTNVQDLMVSNCVRIGAEIYKRCNESLVANIDRIKNQILEKTSSDRSSCLSKIDSGDTVKRDATNNYYWRMRLRERMDDLYSYCRLNNGSLDSYNY